VTALELAIADIGYTERPANSNMTKYGEWYGMNGVAWCVEAVMYWHSKAGDPLPYKTASCTALLNWYRANDPGCIVKTPQKNDLGIMCFGAGRYHIGIVERVNGRVITTIEGNTSSNGSQDNGGAVLRKQRDIGLFVAFIRPRTASKYGGGSMNIVKGSTTSEDAMIRAIQKSIGANVDGEIGAQTMSDIAVTRRADCFPLTLELYGAPVIIARDIVPFSAGGATLGDYQNTINGSFYAKGRPCAILIQDGITIQPDACHAYYGKPESVIYRTFAGEVGIMRVKSSRELPKNLLWAVGGVGLLNNYDPTAEGFCKLSKGGKTEDFSDVLRKTNHSMLGEKNGYMYLVYCASMTAAEVNKLAKTLGLRVAIMLDGGHVAGINGAEPFAKINTREPQYYGIQGVR
jgi:hypothetical protein